MARRVLMVANTLPPVDLSGAGEQVLQLAWGLSREGWEVTLLGRAPGRPKVLFPLLVLPRALHAVRRLRPDVVQVHESDGGFLVIALRLLRRRLPPFLLCALQQVSYREEQRAVRPLRDRETGEVLARPVASERLFRAVRAPWHRMLGRRTARSADLVLAPSNQTALELRRDYGAGRVAVVPNVTGAPVPGRDEKPTDSVAASAEAPFLFVGRLRIRKGVEVLLAAMGALRERLPEARLAIVGGGERESRLRRLIEEGGWGANVEILGRRSPTEIQRLLAGSRALVVPSTYEGMPLVVLEAMAAGVPVIASAVSGIPEVVVDGVTGWLVPPEDVAALAAVLEKAWRRPEAARRLGAAGRERLDRCFRPEAAARRWCEAVLPLLPAQD